VLAHHFSILASRPEPQGSQGKTYEFTVPSAIVMQPTGMESVYDLEKLYGEAQNGGLKFLGQQSMIINCPKNMVGR
jgi:hypothetical protein